MVCLQTFNLSREYQGQPTLRALNLTLHEGEVFCLLGQNGASKTTTLNLCLGFVAPTVGRVLLAGELEQPNHPAARCYSVYIPEVMMLYGNLTALENLDYFSRLANFRYPRPQLKSYLALMLGR